MVIITISESRGRENDFVSDRWLRMNVAVITKRSWVMRYQSALIISKKLWDVLFPVSGGTEERLEDRGVKEQEW